MQTRGLKGSVTLDKTHSKQSPAPKEAAAAKEPGTPAPTGPALALEKTAFTGAPPVSLETPKTRLDDARRLAGRAGEAVGFRAEKSGALPELDDEILGIRPSADRPRADSPDYRVPVNVLTRSGALLNVTEGAGQKQVTRGLWEAVPKDEAHAPDAVEARVLLEGIEREAKKEEKKTGAPATRFDDAKKSLGEVVAADTRYRTQMATLTADSKVLGAKKLELSKQISKEEKKHPGSQKLGALKEQLAGLEARHSALQGALLTAALYSPSRSTKTTERNLDDALPSDLGDARRLLKEARRDLKSATKETEPGIAAREAALAGHVAKLEAAVDDHGIPLHDLEKTVAMASTARKEHRAIEKQLGRLLDGREPDALPPHEHAQWLALDAKSAVAYEQKERVAERMEQLLLHHERDPVEKVLEGGLAKMVASFHEWRVGIGLDEVPQTVDALLDLSPIELERVANHLVDYHGLKEHGVLQGQASVADVVKILSGELEGLGRPLPSSAGEAREMADAVRAKLEANPLGAEGRALAEELAQLERTAEALGRLKQYSGLDRLGLAFSLGVNVGQEGMYSVGLSAGLTVRPKDRKTGERETGAFVDLLGSTPVNSLGYLLKKHDIGELARKGKLKAGLEWSVSPPYVYGGQDPIMGTNIGVSVPMIGGVTLSREMVGLEYNFLDLPGKVGTVGGFLAVSHPIIGRVTGPLIRGAEALVSRIKGALGFGGN